MDINISTVLEMYENGESTLSISKHFNTYPNKIRRILVSEGVELRDKSSAQKKALETGRIKHPTKGTKRSYETRSKISQSNVKAWQDMSESERERRRQIAQDHWAAKSPEEILELQRLAGAALSEAGKQGSKAERFLYEHLTGQGYNITMHDSSIVGGAFECDLVIHDKLIAIEVDGPQHFEPVFGEEHLRNYVKNDAAKNGALISKGYTVIRVKYMAKNSTLAVLNRLLEVVTEQIDKVENGSLPTDQKLIEVEL